ncbi:MAG TPA: hypothetical protein VGX91_08315 [Candidatus Cybelea sp.]|jgi:hypothetical protein|nr:hypothetical protein [Candidatus Cybelea sp.]
MLRIGIAAVLLAGCGASSADLLQSPLSATRSSSVKRVPSNVQGQKEALIYVAYGLNGAVMYDYATMKPKGTLSGFESANGLCADAAQNVYVVDVNREAVYKFAHGAQEPEDTFADSGGFPVNCSVNPRNGDLAAVNAVRAATLGVPEAPLYQVCGFQVPTD